MNSGWIERSFLDVCEAYQPKTISMKEMVPDGLYPVYGANGVIGRYDKFNHEETEVLLGCRGTCGAVNLSEPRSWITGNAMVIKPKNAEITRQFIKYYLEGASRFAGIITGVAQPQITRKSLAPLRISYPPLQEQRRIVAILDEAAAGLAIATANAEKNLKNARGLFDSYLDLAIEGRLLPQDFGDASVTELIEEIERLRAAKIGQKKFEKSKKAVTNDGAHLPFALPKNWALKRLEELTSVIADGVHKTPKYVDHGIPFVTVKNLTVGPGISFEGINYVTRADHREFIKRTHPEKGDILITKDGTIGVVRVVDTDVEFSIFVSVALIKPVMRELSRYLAHAVSASCVQRQIVPKGAALKHLYLVDLRNLLVPLPPLAEQARIAKELDLRREQTDRLERIYREKLSFLREVKQSILRKAFSGELTSSPSQAIKEAAE